MRTPGYTFAVPIIVAMLLAGGCAVGPKYRQPDVPLTPSFKESLPEGWKQAEPNDGRITGKWWELYDDRQLNALQEQIALSNQNVLMAEAQYREARAAVRSARSSLFPTLSTAPAATESRNGSASSSAAAVAPTGMRTFYTFPAAAAWEPDVWGSVRRGVTAASAQAQASAADLANATLLYQSELAQDYFLLHGADSAIDLLQRTVQSYEQYLKLTRDRLDAGVASDLDVAQAESQMEAARTQLIDLGVARAQYEHAIAVLTGKPPAALTLNNRLLTAVPPRVPVTVPSALLERRPDIAAGERLVAAANEQIGIAKAAFFPSILLGGSGGFQASSIATWLSWPSEFFSLGPSVAETIFDAGKRRAQVAQYQAAYDAIVASYRQSVLIAFQQVEDALAAERILADEAAAADRAVKAAERQLAIATAQYKAGTASYLTVITAQTALLSTQRTRVDLLTRRFVTSVSLIVSLGGGWDVSYLPSAREVRSSSPSRN
jgi:NodT family efflux transporter outer membrane factor (OMF) lipoprotein